MRRVLVTGGAGFLGSHLCARLLARGDEVICVDNFYTGRKANVLPLLEHRFFELIRHDITSPLQLEVDCIFNLACPASPVHYQLHPVETIKACVHGSINMLELARRLGVRILQASTSEVYGDPSIHPQVEHYWGNVNPIGPRSCYDEGKRCAESLFFDYRRQYGLSVRVARIFNTYGPHMLPDDGRVVSNFIVQALTGAPLTVFGDGSQTRSFCYVDDLVAGLIGLMEYPDDAIGPVNLGNPGEISMVDLAEMVLSLTESRSEIVFTAGVTDDPSRRCPDIHAALRLLGWRPRVPLSRGLPQTIDYFSETIPAGVTHAPDLRLIG